MNKEILKLALPNIISNLSVPLLSIVDVALMGHLPSSYFIVAVGFGSALFNFIYWGFGFLRMGTTGFTAQAFGEKHFQKSIHILLRGLVIAIGIGLLLIGGQNALLNLGLAFFKTSENVANQLSAYFHVRIFAAPATLSGYVVVGWLLGMQKAKSAMSITVVVNLINILGNYYFVVHDHMAADGVALGTVIAQYAGLLIGLSIILYTFPEWKMHLQFTKIFSLQPMVNFFKVNFDIFIRTLCLIFTFAYFKNLSGELSLAIGAANIILLEFFTIAAYGIDGFSFAAEAIVGKYFGANDSKNLQRSIYHLFFWGVGLGLFFSLVFYVFGDSILGIITDQTTVVETANDYLFWMILSPVFMAVPFIWDGIYIGLTASRAMRNSMLIATLFCFLPAQYLLIKIWNNHGLWLALLLFFIARGVIQSLIGPKLLKRKDLKNNVIN